MIGATSVLAIGLSVQHKEIQESNIPATGSQKSHKSQNVADLTSENLKDREQTAEAIRNEHTELIKQLIQLAAAKIEPLPSSDLRFIEYPWHDSKHLAILLLGELRATDGVSVLLDNLVYKNPKTLYVDEPLDKGGWHPAVESLSKIGMPAVEPTIKKLSSYEPKSKGSELCCWILKKILGVRLARLRLQIAIEETRDKAVRKNLIETLPYFKTDQEKAAEERARREKTAVRQRPSERHWNPRMTWRCSTKSRIAMIRQRNYCSKLSKANVSNSVTLTQTHYSHLIT